MLTENKEAACWPLSASRVTFSRFCDLSHCLFFPFLEERPNYLSSPSRAPAGTAFKLMMWPGPRETFPLPGENSGEAEGRGCGALWEPGERLSSLAGLITMAITSVLESTGLLSTLEAGSFRGFRSVPNNQGVHWPHIPHSGRCGGLSTFTFGCQFGDSCPGLSINFSAMSLSDLVEVAFMGWG